MHELGIARDICEAAARATGGRPITSMVVNVGILAGVSADALDFCITEIARAEGLGEPGIVINESPAVFDCACGKQYSAAEMTEACPSCAGYERELLSGMDIVVERIEFEKEE